MNADGSSLTRAVVFLPPRQAEILAFVRAYTTLAGEPVSASLVARRFGRDVATIRDHFAALHPEGLAEDASVAGVAA